MKRIAFYFLLLICSIPITTAQEYEIVVIDSIVSVQLPLNSFSYIDNDSISQIYQFSTYSYSETEDMTYAVIRIRTDDRVCLSNRNEMKTYYKEINQELLKGEKGLKLKYNSTFNDNHVYQGVLEYNSFDEDEGVQYNSDYRFIQIKETLYQFSIYRPARTVEKQVSDDFFNSISINKDYWQKNQFTKCNSFDLLFDTDQKESSQDYSTAYRWGYMMGGFICFGLVIGLVALVIYLIVRKNRKKSQEHWDEFNK